MGQTCYATYFLGILITKEQFNKVLLKYLETQIEYRENIERIKEEAIKNEEDYLEHIVYDFDFVSVDFEGCHFHIFDSGYRKTYLFVWYSITTDAERDLFVEIEAPKLTEEQFISIAEKHEITGKIVQLLSAEIL